MSDANCSGRYWDWKHKIDRQNCANLTDSNWAFFLRKSCAKTLSQGGRKSPTFIKVIINYVVKPTQVVVFEKIHQIKQSLTKLSLIKAHDGVEICWLKKTFWSQYKILKTHDKTFTSWKQTSQHHLEFHLLMVSEKIGQDKSALKKLLHYNRCINQNCKNTS